MKKVFTYIALISLFLLVNCATTGFGSKTGIGFVFMDVKEGVSNSAASPGSKTGEACSMNVLGLVAVGDASIKAARSAGGITKVATVDAHYFNVISLFGKHCIIVTGE